MKYIGFIINSRVAEPCALRKGIPPHALLTGWDDSGSPMSFMRFRWIADALRVAKSDLRYELYRPWRSYDAVVFLKSMGSHCLSLARRLRKNGTRIIFEANVDYYSQFAGEARLEAMVPSAEQREDAIAITEFSDAVIASSRQLSDVCRTMNSRVKWIPDNVNLRLRPTTTQIEPVRDGRLQVWWSGMAAKLFEFVAAEEAFLAFSDRVHLHLVTDDVAKAAVRWPQDVREQLERFLARVPHTFHRFQNIPHLLGLYANGGVIVSPRFLDAPYNLSHTEWKITLGMACDLPAIASPVPSYVDAAARSVPDAVAICDTSADWLRVFEGLLRDPGSVVSAGAAARETVTRHYETSVVAMQHAAWIEEICSRAKS